MKSSQQDLGLILAELRPAALEGQGIAVAVQNYLDAWNQHTRILSELRVQGERTLPLAVEQALYRIAQEALSNVARHSSASLVTIDLVCAEQQVKLVVQDNGAASTLPRSPGAALGWRACSSAPPRWEARSRSSASQAAAPRSPSIPLNPGGNHV